VENLVCIPGDKPRPVSGGGDRGFHDRTIPAVRCENIAQVGFLVFTQPMGFGNRNAALLKPTEVMLVRVPTHQNSIVNGNTPPDFELRVAKVLLRGSAHE
jgi:hypothetical protein